MKPILLLAIITITLALVFYTIGVFAERKAHVLKKSHIIIFWLGLVCDTTGTTLMSVIARQGSQAMGIGVHGVTGAIAILLMVFHAVWATLTYTRKKEEQMQQFHKFSLFVWLVWLVPYLIGMFMGMQ